MDQALPALDEIDLPTFYAIAIFPTWEHWHPTDCPMPIREWLNEHCPDVTVDAVSRWCGRLAIDLDRDEILDASAFPEKVFRLGLTDQEAVEFQQWWSDPSNPGAATEENFYFCKVTNPNYEWMNFVTPEDFLNLELPPWNPPEQWLAAQSDSTDSH